MEITTNKIKQLIKSTNFTQQTLYSLPSGSLPSGYSFSDLIAKLPHLEEETLIIMTTPIDNYLLMWSYKLEYVEYEYYIDENYEHIAMCCEDLRVDKYLLEASFHILGKWEGDIL